MSNASHGSYVNICRAISTNPFLRSLAFSTQLKLDSRSNDSGLISDFESRYLMNLLLPATLSSGHFSPLPPRQIHFRHIAPGIRMQSVAILKTQPFAAYRTIAQSGPDGNDYETSYEEMPLFLFRADESNPSP